MKKYIIFSAVVLLLLTKTTAQSVGINNNTPDASAVLDITSTTKGMLIPRLTQAQRLAIAGPAKGLLVYDSTSNSFWYRNGAAWQELGTAASAWNLNGNAGTDPSINFIGTTDDQPLRFRINNAWAGELNPSFLNVSFGSGAGQPATTGVYNVGIGVNTLHSNNTGNTNTANGSNSLFTNTTGSSNTVSGYSALYSNTTGNFNVANGYEALYLNTTGNQNTAYGYDALYNNTTGNSNTANGPGALYNNTTGSYNTSLGIGADVSSGNLTNATAIGYIATVNASNKVRIGNSGVTVIEGQVDWSFPSDGRFKTNVTETVKGLDFIMKLRPVVYNFQTKKYDDFLRGDLSGNAKFVGQDFSKSESIRHSGFVAQEVEQAAKEAGYDFNGIIVPENDQQTYSLSYAQFVVPLVKAVQELNNKMEDQQQQIDQFKKNNALLSEQNKQATADNEQLQLQLQNLIATVSALNKKVEMLAVQTGITSAVAANDKK